jgi:hypothetical protein
VSETSHGDEKKDTGRRGETYHAYLILSHTKKKGTQSTRLPSHRGGPWTSYLSSRVEWNLKILGKYMVIKQISAAREKSYEGRSVTGWHHDRDGRCTVAEEGGEGEEKKGVKVRARSSYAENARSENLKGIRRSRIWPEDAVNGMFRDRRVDAHPTAVDPRDQVICNVSHCSFIACEQSGKATPKKIKLSTGYGYRNCCSGRVPVKEESLKKSIVGRGKKKKKKGSDERKLLRGGEVRHT